MSDIWKDPMVKVALKDGRSADDIAVLDCPKCGTTGYYNQGSHFSCRKCRRVFYCCSEDEVAPVDGRAFVRLDDFRTLADTVQYDGDGDHY